ncbi:hypothetical protein KL909_002474 [Ogataea angusta]|nr:hypothetical protein KL909_002474 [Ogataea angusta]
MDSSSDRGLEDDLEFDNDFQHTPLSDYGAGEAAKESAALDAAKFELEAQQALKSQILILCSALGGADDSGKYVLGLERRVCVRRQRPGGERSDPDLGATAGQGRRLEQSVLPQHSSGRPGASGGADTAAGPGHGAGVCGEDRPLHQAEKIARPVQRPHSQLRGRTVSEKRCWADNSHPEHAQRPAEPQGHGDPKPVSEPVPQRAAHRAGGHDGGSAAQHVQDAAAQRQHAARRQQRGHQFLAHGVRFPRQQGAAVCADDHGGARARVRRARAGERVSRHLLLPALRARPSHCGGAADGRGRVWRCSHRADAGLCSGAREGAQEKAAEQQRDAPRQLRHAAEHSAGRRARADGVWPETADPRRPAGAARCRRFQEGRGGAADGQQEREHAVGL